jgi:hypothetical protein
MRLQRELSEVQEGHVRKVSDLRSFIVLVYSISILIY